MTDRLARLLESLEITPVLMDVGASGQPPPIWERIAAQSVYVGFDADAREIHEDRVSGFRRSVIINEAVTHLAQAPDLNFYLTRSPFCSTTLAPNPEATAHWLERDLFVVEKTSRVRATTIDDVLKRLQFDAIDWLKLDTQGTDLRLINSISPEILSRVMAIDTEPGLIEIYQREDMFVDVHRDLTSKGFWLSGMRTGGFVRMRRGTLEAAASANAGIDEAYIRRSVRTSPAYLEATYLRTLEWLADMSLSAREYQLLWVFALMENQFGFALDVSAEFTRRFGGNDASRDLDAATMALLKTARRRHFAAVAANRVGGAVRSLVNRLAG